MKSKLIALAIFAATAATVALYPAYHSIGAANPPVDPLAVHLPPLDPLTHQRPLVEVVFALDTTGSMSGLIQAAKEKIWSIATTLAQAQPAPEIRMGLVAYRDRGDVYVTRVVDLSDDLDSMYATLMDFQADGGGDGPESVNQALYDAVHRISWSSREQAYRVVFLVGDAPAHMDYQDDVKYPITLAAAAEKGIVVNAIQCGHSDGAAREWRRVAQLGKGKYFQVEQGGSAVAIATPFDEELAALSVELDGTRLYYGSKEQKAEKQRKLDATDKLHAASSVASRARRAAFNASESGAANLLGEGELVHEVTNGQVDLSAVEPAALPTPMQSMAPKEQQALIETTAKRREQLRAQIRQLSERRHLYLKQKVAETGGAEDSLDDKIFSAVRDQAGKEGMAYETDAPTY